MRKSFLIRIFVVISCMAMFFILVLSDAGALTLTAGQSATFSFDFSSSSLPPPYNDFHADFSTVVLTSGGEMYLRFYDDPTDPNGSNFWTAFEAWSFFEPQTLWDGELAFDLASDVTEKLLYVTFEVTSGTIQDPTIALAMSYNGTLTGFIEGQPVSQVPEPGILILLGISMMGVAGLKRWWRG